MHTPAAQPIEATPAGFDAIATLYNALMTGLVLTLIRRRGEPFARDFVQAHFRRQHHAKFLPGLRKLGLDNAPHAVACALYHYHSNALGGVRTEYHYENDRKAWVRYPPPRWIWRGTAACAIPHSVNIAMLYGWHAQNGVSLANPRLGFVCTGTLTSGAAGLEGYYYEHEHDLAPDARLRFASDERMPKVVPASQPALDSANWPTLRLQKTHRSYAAEYVRSLVPTLMSMLPAEAAAIEIGHAARLIGMQFYDELASKLGNTRDTAGFAHWLAQLLAAQGEATTLCSLRHDSAEIEIRDCHLFSGLGLTVGQRALALSAWNELWVGAALAHDRFMQLRMELRNDGGLRWQVSAQ